MRDCERVNTSYHGMKTTYIPRNNESVQADIISLSVLQLFFTLFSQSSNLSPQHCN